METTVGGGVGVGVVRDCISNLPDSLLVTILSSLPMHEAARCSTLASRWRHLFSSTLLNFKLFATSRDQDVVKTVTTILAAHPTQPICSFTVGDLHLRRLEDKAALDAWLRDLSTRGIQKLSLYFNYMDHEEIPDSIFACSSLKHLRMTHGALPDTNAASLANLTKIYLFRVRISEDSLNSLLSQCGALEHLTIVSCNLHTLHIRSQSLKVLNLTGGNFQELFIHDAPNLEHVLDTYMGQTKVHIKVGHTPKLHSLAYIGMSNKMEIRGTTFCREGLKDVQSLMPSMKTLGVDLSCDHKGYIYIDWLMQLLKLFPCLETLYITSSSWFGAQDVMSGSWDMHTSIPCTLEKVVFQVYRGHQWQREMAKFLHGRSNVLKTMEFHCMGASNGHPTEEWVREQKELLCLDSATARDASFLFFKGQMVVNHLEVFDEERYQRNYYRHLYFDESVLRR